MVFERAVTGEDSFVEQLCPFSNVPFTINIPIANYHVFVSFDYNYWTSAPGSTYSIYPASSAANNITVTKETYGFFVSFTKATGDAFNGKLTCLVVFTTVS